MLRNCRPLLLHAVAFWLIPSLLVFIALVQQYRARVLDQSSWIGCGFGMFATLDNHTSRYLQARLVGPDGGRPVPVPNQLHRLETRARVIPTADNVSRLADSMWQQLAGETGDAQLELQLYHVRLDPRLNRLDADPRVTVRRP